MDTEKRPTMLPPAASEPCEEELRNSCVDWDAILAGGPVSRESLKMEAGLVHLRLWAEEYDAIAAEANGDPVPASIRNYAADDLATVRPEALKQAG